MGPRPLELEKKIQTNMGRSYKEFYVRSLSLLVRTDHTESFIGPARETQQEMFQMQPIINVKLLSRVSRLEKQM